MCSSCCSVSMECALLSLLLPLQSPCHTCSQLLPALKLQTFLVHLAFYIEHWKYILVICGRTIISHAGKIVFMVPAGKQVHQFQSTTVLLFLPPSFVSWSNIIRTSCPRWAEPGFSPIFEIKSICSAVCVFQCCPQNNHWVLAEHNNSYYVPQIFGFGCAATLHL